jgi:chorismate synthase
MGGSLFGRALTVTTFGESHGPAVGCVVDGCPAGVALDEPRVAAWLARRRPGAGTAGASARQEADTPKILSGVYQGLTLGSPIAILVENRDARPQDYPTGRLRPGHADATTQVRFGVRDPRGGGRSSARETVGRVAAGAVAEALLDAWSDQRGRPRIETVAWVQELAGIAANLPPPHAFVDSSVGPRRADVDPSPLRCPDPVAVARMQDEVAAARERGDSLGGVVRCVVRHVPAGLGDPVFDKLSGTLAHALLSLPAARGVEFGSGADAAKMSGSTHNDAFADTAGLQTATNHAGGLLGGITTGMPLVLDVAFKPPSTIAGPATNRHDAVVLPRAVPIVEAAVLFCLADALLRPGRLHDVGFGAAP